MIWFKYEPCASNSSATQWNLLLNCVIMQNDNRLSCLLKKEVVMVAGHLNERNGYYHCAYLLWRRRKRKYKWISTGLPIKGNKRKAEAILLCEREKFVPPSEIKIIPKEEKKANILFADFLLEWLEYDRSSPQLRKPAFGKRRQHERDTGMARAQQFFNNGKHLCSSWLWR